MSKFRNASKYKHIVGTVSKKELWYPDLKAIASSGDYNSVAASTHYVAAVSSAGNSVLLLDLQTVGKRASSDLPTIHAHSSAICDLAFSPFNDLLLVTSSEDATVKLWELEAKSKTNLTEPKKVLSGHKKRIDSLEWNPVAADILATGSSDKTLKVWNTQTGKEICSVEHPDVVHSVSWNYNGSLIATSCKDKKIRVIDARNGNIIQSGEGHQGLKASRVKFLGNSGLIATTGFSKTRDRQFAIWDASNLEKPLKMNIVDSSTGVLEIFWDQDSSLLFLAGKGDGIIRIYEVADKDATELTPCQSSETQKSTAILPKRGVDLMGAEIVRLFKLTASAVVPVSFVVPRKTKSEFQEDLFPPTASSTPALKAEEWESGSNKDPILIHLKPKSTGNFWEEEPKKESVPDSQASTYEASTTYTQPQQFSAHSKFAIPEKPKEEARELKTVKVVRTSKFRHIAGKGTKMEACYTSLQINTANNNSMIRANPKFIVVPWQGAGGRMAVIPFTRTGRQADKLPCLECGSDCLDFDWNPFDDNMLASVTESAHVQIWKVPEGGLTADIRTPDRVMKGHTRRVTTVDFHPNASNLVVTSAGDWTVRIWDIEKGVEAFKLKDHSDFITSLNWDNEGAQLLTSCKDKFLRIIDARSDSVISKTEGHDGAKGFKATFMGNTNQILSVGFSKTSERTIKLWDRRNMGNFITEVKLDTGAGFITPYYDQDTGVAYMVGKGDGNLKMFEINDEAPFIHYLTEFPSNIPMQGMAPLPKTMCNVKDCEISTWIKLAGDYAEQIHFTVPRTRMDYFQDDIFPPTRDVRTPALTGDEWISGKTRGLPLVDLKPFGMTPLSQAQVETKAKKYDFNTEINRDANAFNKDKFINTYYDNLTGQHGEKEEQVLKQDLMEGATDAEWDDY